MARLTILSLISFVLFLSLIVTLATTTPTRFTSTQMAEIEKLRARGVPEVRIPLAFLLSFLPFFLSLRIRSLPVSTPFSSLSSLSHPSSSPHFDPPPFSLPAERGRKSQL